jgi:hypothetical protein
VRTAWAGARVETRDPLRDRVPRRQDQDRQIVTGAAQLPAHLEAVEPRHHHIQHDGVGPVVGDQIERFDTVLSQLYRVPVEGQGPAQGFAHGTIVIDDKNAHSLSFNPTPERRLRGAPL